MDKEQVVALGSAAHILVSAQNLEEEELKALAACGFCLEGYQKVLEGWEERDLETLTKHKGSLSWLFALLVAGRKLGKGEENIRTIYSAFMQKLCETYSISPKDLITEMNGLLTLATLETSNGPCH